MYKITIYITSITSSDSSDMEKHALKMCTNACFHLQSIRKIRRCLTMESCKILVHSLVTSRLDYANILLCNAPDRVTARLEESTEVRCETDLWNTPLSAYKHNGCTS